jgi:hypothetical protein
MANFYSNLNLKRNQLLLPVIHPSGSVPAGTNVQGQLYFNNTDGSEELYLCTSGGDTGTWIALSVDTNTQNTAAQIRTKIGSGNNGHVPTTGTAGHFLKHDGTFGLPSYIANTDTQNTAAEIRTKIGSGNNGHVPTTGTAGHFLKHDGTFGLPSYIANTNTQNTAAQIRTKIGSGNNGHVPTTGTAGHFLKHDGTFGLPSYIANTNTQNTAAEIRTKIGSGNNGHVPTTGTAGHFLKHDGTFGLPSYTTNTDTNTQNTYTALTDGLTITSFDIAIDGSQTLITDIYNTGLIVGRDSTDNINFASDNNIIFKASDANQVKITDGTFEPIANNDISLGTSTKAFTYLYVNQSIQPAFHTASDQDGNDITIRGGQSTGTGAGGSILFKTSPASGSSGTAQNNGVEALKIETDLKATFAGEVVIDGDLTVSGTTTTINTATVTINDNIILLNSDQDGDPDATAAWDAGIEVERGSATNVRVMWDEGDDEWTFTNDGSTYYAIPTANTTYDVMNSSNSYVAGLVPTGNATHGDGFLRRDGTWRDVSSYNTDTQNTAAQIRTKIGSGNNGHVPTTGTAGHFLKHDGTFGLPSYIANTNTQNTAAEIRTKIGSGNNGHVPTTGTAGHFLKHDGTFGLPSYTTNTNDNTQLPNVVAIIDVSALTSSSQLVTNITHGLGGGDISVQLWETTSGTYPYYAIEADVQRYDANTVRVTFGRIPTNDVRVVMIAENTSDLASSAVNYPS